MVVRSDGFGATLSDYARYNLGAASRAWSWGAHRYRCDPHDDLSLATAGWWSLLTTAAARPG